MKKLIAAMLVLSMSFALAACGAGEKETAEDLPVKQEEPVKKVPPAEEKKPESPKEKEPDPRLEQILVTVDYDAALSQAIVHVENTSNATFDSTVNVRFQYGDGKKTPSESIFVESLLPGEKTFARLSVQSTENVTMTHEFGMYPEFTETTASKAEGETSTVDADLSQKLTGEFNGSFGGAGNPEWATSWHGNVDKIEVFKSESGNSVTVTVNTDDQEKIDRIGNTISGNYTKDYNLLKVTVVNAAGVELFSKY